MQTTYSRLDGWGVQKSYYTAAKFLRRNGVSHNGTALLTYTPTPVDLEDKFHCNASPILDQSSTDSLYQADLSLDKTEA